MAAAEELLHPPRLAGPDDVAALVALSGLLVREAEGVAPSPLFLQRTRDLTIEALQDRDSRIYLIEAGAPPVAIATLRVEIRRSGGGAPAMGFITEVFVEPPYRRRGLTRSLLARAEGFLREQEVVELRLETQLGHAAAETYWRRQGFQPFRAVWRRGI